MPRSRYYDVAQLTDANGFVKKVSNPQVTVYQQGTTTPIAETLFAADSGGATLTNPFNGNANGEIEFYKDTPGRVSIKISGAAVGLGEVTRNMEPVWPDPASLNSTIWSPNGMHSASISNDGVFTAPGLLRFLGCFFVGDHGITSAMTGAQVTAALNALIPQLAALGFGNIRLLFGPTNYNIGPGLNVDHNQGSGASKNIRFEGVRGQTSFTLTGTAGPWISWGTNANSPINGGGMEEIMIFFADVPASGAVIRTGNLVGAVEFNNVRIRAGSNAHAALIGYQIGIAGFGGGGIAINDGKVELRRDNATLESQGKTPVGILVANDVATTSITVRGTGVDGGQEASEARRSIAMQFNNTQSIDTVKVENVSFKDHAIAYYVSGNCAAALTNLWISDAIFDVCDTANVVLQPGIGGSVNNLLIKNPWFSSKGTNILQDNGNLGTVADLSIVGGKTFDAEVAAINVGNGLTGFLVEGLISSTSINNGSRYAYSFAGDAGSGGSGCTDVICQGCKIFVSPGAGNTGRIGTNVPCFDIRGNLLIGKNQEMTYAGTLNAARKLDNTWRA